MIKSGLSERVGFLIENPIRSAFFIVKAAFMCFVPSSSWLEGKAKTPAGSAAARGKRRLAWKSLRCNKRSAHASHLFVFRLDLFLYVSNLFFG
ncbi:hypothetical protein [Priestia megaterium]|uniref:hypothetical protein n=1 Tax=Priestia megaterium TaxID=1404 RepID=UPI003CECA673